MPRYVRDDTVIETSSPREGVRLKAMGFKEQAASVKAVKPTAPITKVEPVQHTERTEEK